MVKKGKQLNVRFTVKLIIAVRMFHFWLAALEREEINSMKAAAIVLPFLLLLARFDRHKNSEKRQHH